MDKACFLRGVCAKTVAELFGKELEEPVAIGLEEDGGVDGHVVGLVAYEEVPAFGSRGQFVKGAMGIFQVAVRDFDFGHNVIGSCFGCYTGILLDGEEVSVVEPIGYGEIVLEDVVSADEFQFALDTYEVFGVLVHADGVEMV